jgi:glycogen operon protein
MTTMLEAERALVQSDACAGLAQGTSWPLGATPSPEGVNFSVFSKHATGVELLFFDRVDDAEAARVIRIDPTISRTYHYWHVLVPGVTAGQLYGYRVEGPWDPASGMRFDPMKVLLDPYRRSNLRRTSCRGRSRPRGPIVPIGRRSIQRSCCSPRSGERKFLSRLVNRCGLHHRHFSSTRCAGRCVCAAGGRLRARQLGREVTGGKYFRAACAGRRGRWGRDR